MRECLRLSNFEALAVSKTPCTVIWFGENTRQAKHQLLRASAACACLTNTLLQVTYASKPQAAGGPFLRSAPGKLIFSSQKLRQTLIPTNSLVNSVSFKALGIVPGNAIQDAVIEMLSGTKYKVQ